jgi:arylsulfatase A-like enzyme/Flp pilus assembly protein TadD
LARASFRHSLILILVALGTAMAAFGGWRFARASAPVNGPIILISIDALRADRLPAYGYTNIRTPAIDTLAADGVLFERAYSNVPQTLPAHAALHTGRLPFDTGVRDGVGFTIKSSERLLAEMLRDRGFSTAGIVSSYLLRKDTGINQGFTFFDAELPGGSDQSRFEPLHRDGAASEQIAERWLNSAGTDRAFLFLQIDDVRGAAAAPPVMEARSGLRAGGSSPRALPNDALQSAYDDAIVGADQVVGRLVRYLKAHQLYDRSTIVLLSGHGQGLGDHGEQAHGLLLYDEALRIPLIVKQPAGENAGRRVKAVAQLVDIVPTILDLAKAPDPGGLRGHSLKPVIDRGEDPPPTRLIYAESLFGSYHFGWGALRSVTDGQFRYIAGPQPELYDLTVDPGQQDNLVEQKPDTVASMKSALEAFDHGAPQPPAAVSGEERDRLEILGYVGVLNDDDAAPAADAVARPLVQPTGGGDQVRLVEQYRAAALAAASSDPAAAIERFRTLAHAQSGSADLWWHLAAAATRAERHELAAEAFARALELQPRNPWTALGLASASLKLRRFDDARQHATLATESAADDKIASGAAHELLARVALARRDEASARAEAALAEESVPGRPVLAYVDGRIAHEQGRYAAAAEAFDTALAAIEKAKAPMLADLRYYAADTLLRLNRTAEAEYLFLEELKAAPFNARTRAGLAAVYRSTGRTDEAAATLGGH